MVIHEVGILYHQKNLQNYFLGVSSLTGERQLIWAMDANILFKNRRILLFHTNEPRIWEHVNPLEDEVNRVIQIGQIDTKSVQPLDCRVTEYINLDKSRKMVNTLLNEKEGIVVLPPNFDKHYII